MCGMVGLKLVVADLFKEWVMHRLHKPDQAGHPPGGCCASDYEDSVKAHGEFGFAGVGTDFGLIFLSGRSSFCGMIDADSRG